MVHFKPLDIAVHIVGSATEILSSNDLLDVHDSTGGYSGEVEEVTDINEQANAVDIYFVNKISWPTQVTAFPPGDPGNFNRSEEVAWNSAAGLRSLITTKQSARQAGGTLTVIGHSMGGIVVSEALAQIGNNPLVDTTVLTQAAVSSQLYTSTAAPTPYYGVFAGAVGGATPRFARLDQATVKFLNYNNEGDYAVGYPNVPGTGLVSGAWMVNYRAKPGGPSHGTAPTQTGFLGATYEVAAGPPATLTRYVPNAAPTALRAGIDTYEMLAHGLYTSDELAIGGIAAMPAPLTGQFDLRTIGFGLSRTDHSGEFNHSNVEMNAYWARLMQDAGLNG